MDIVFVLGASDRKKMETAKNLATKIVDLVHINNSRFAIVRYEQTSTLVSGFANSDNKPTLMEKIRRVVWNNRGTGVDRGIMQGQDLLKRTGRDDAKQLIVVFASGRASASESQLRNLGNKLRSENVKVIVVTIGDDVEQKVKVVAGTGDDEVDVDSTKDDDTNSKMVTKKIFKGNVNLDSYEIFL